MFKKLNLFLSTKLRQNLESDPNFGKHKGLQAAILLPYEIVRLCLLGPCQMIEEEEAQKLRWGNLYKFLDGTHCESDDLMDAFKSATRIEAYVYQWVDNLIALEIAFHSKSKPWVLRTSFSSSGKHGSITWGNSLTLRGKQDRGK
jgi:hypothetical protein